MKGKFKKAKETRKITGADNRMAKNIRKGDRARVVQYNPLKNYGPLRIYFGIFLIFFVCCVPLVNIIIFLLADIFIIVAPRHIYNGEFILIPGNWGYLFSIPHIILSFSLFIKFFDGLSRSNEVFEKYIPKFVDTIFDNLPDKLKQNSLWIGFFTYLFVVIVYNTFE